MFETSQKEGEMNRREIRRAYRKYLATFTFDLVGPGKRTIYYVDKDRF